MAKPTANKSSARHDALSAARVDHTDKPMVTDQGVRIENTDDSLRIGERGPTLLEDFHLREKIMRFDHERIPERAVHARGSAAHGYFQVYKPLTELTCASFLQDPSKKTPVFTRFSTVAGPRGSADTVRDVRGFATKFYTDEGNFDLVGNNIPVFFIQDGIKFPDIIHAVKGEPHNEMPTAASAHDTFWDFVSLQPESAHMVMWVMSDRAIPRSLRMMEGFGVHTFRMVNQAGKSTFVKFHWKPKLGVHGLTWDEAQKLAGFDPDFHRRDLWETIASGGTVEWELGLQIVTDKLAQSLGADLLDATKLIPEERAPVELVGKMVLNRNPDNYFAETEQVAYCVSNVVPGIDVTDDPLMQARLFSYLDTQLTRLGGPNFAQLPINQPRLQVTNHQQDGAHQHQVPTTQANYHPNSIGGGCPFLSSAKQGGYVHYPEAVEGDKVRARAESFGDHFSQATSFYASLTPPEQQHLQAALTFELSKVTRPEIRERMVGVLAQVNAALATSVAGAIGIRVPAAKPAAKSRGVFSSAVLSMVDVYPKTIATRKVACLCAPDADAQHIEAIRDALAKKGATLEVLAPTLAPLKSGKLPVDKPWVAAPSVMYDAVYIPPAPSLQQHRAAALYVEEAFMHGKAIAASGSAALWLMEVLRPHADQSGVVTSDGPAAKIASKFVDAIAAHRHWSRAAT